MQEHMFILCLFTKALLKSSFIGQFSSSTDSEVTELSNDITISIYGNILKILVLEMCELSQLYKKVMIPMATCCYKQ